jgi:hypothetical protein
MSYQTTITAMAIHLESESPIFGESTVHVALEDEAAGIFLIIKDGEGGTVKIDFEQWELLCKAVDTLKKQKCEGM